MGRGPVTGFLDPHANFTGLLDVTQFFHQRIKFGVRLAYSRSNTEPTTYAIDAMDGESQHQIHRLSPLYKI